MTTRRLSAVHKYGGIPTRIGWLGQVTTRSTGTRLDDPHDPALLPHPVRILNAEGYGPGGRIPGMAGAFGLTAEHALTRLEYGPWHLTPWRSGQLIGGAW